MGESPYFPTLRGPRRRLAGNGNAGGGVTNAAFALSVNAATLDGNSKGEDVAWLSDCCVVV